VPSDRDYEFARLAVESGLLSQEQADALLSDLTAAAALGANDSISQVAVKRGLLSEDECRALVERVERAAGRRVAIGGFQILERIGRGGMGAVYRARQLSMDREVALKILARRLARSEPYVKRFIREARAAAKLDHPNIVQGIDVGRSGGYYYFAMEFIDGETAAQRLKRDGPMDEKAALNIALQVAQALEHAHSRANIIHRDVKPQNILITHQGTAKLADLGLARQTLQADAAITYSGVALGTPDYIAPEQIRGEMNLDGRCDIYALGATLYHLLVGRPPYRGETANVTMAKHLTDPVPDPSRERAGLSPDTCNLVHKAMQKEKTARFQTAEAMVGALRHALHQVDRRADAPAVSAPDGHAVLRRPRRSERRLSPAILWSLAALLLMLGGLAAILATFTGDKAPLLPTMLPAETSSPGQALPPPGGEGEPLERESVARRAYLHAQDLAARNRGKPWLVVSELEDMLAQCEGTEYQSAVSLLLDAARSEWSSLAQSALAELEGQAAPLIRAKRFDEAAAVFDRFPSHLLNEAWRRRRDAARRAVVEQGKSAWAALRAEAEAAAKAGDFDRAIAMCRDVPRWGMPEAAQQASGLVETWRVEARQAKERRAEQRFRAAITRMGEVIDALKERRNADAWRLAKQAADDPTMGEQRGNFERLAADIGRIIGLWDEAERQIKALKPGDPVRVGSILRQFVKYEDGQVTGQVSGLSQTIALRAMNEADLFSLLTPYFRRQANAAEALLARGLFYTFDALRDFDKARKDFAAVEALGAKDDARRCRGYIEMIAALEPEREALALLAQCREAVEAKQWPRLTAWLGKLEQFRKTKAYRRNPSEITRMALQAAGRGLTLTDLLGGEVTLQGADRVTVNYDFARREHRAAWRGGEGGAERLQSPYQLRWDAGIEIESLALRCPPLGGAQGLEVRVMSSPQGSHAAVVATLGRDGRFDLHGFARRRGKVALRPTEAYQVALELKDGTARLSLDGKPLGTVLLNPRRAPDGRHLILQAVGPAVALYGVTLSGRLDLAWARDRIKTLADIAEGTLLGTFEVPANRPTIDTGLVIEAGTYYHLKARGWWQYGPGRFHRAGAAGLSSTLNDRPGYALLGKAGDETIVCGEEVLIGRGSSYRPVLLRAAGAGDEHEVREPPQELRKVDCRNPPPEAQAAARPTHRPGADRPVLQRTGLRAVEARPDRRAD